MDWLRTLTNGARALVVSVAAGVFALVFNLFNPDIFHETTLGVVMLVILSSIVLAIIKRKGPWLSFFFSILFVSAAIMLFRVVLGIYPEHALVLWLVGLIGIVGAWLHSCNTQFRSFRPKS